MRDYEYPACFPGEDKAMLEAAAEATGLSVNQIIVRSVHERLPVILAEHQTGKLDLSPLPDSAVAAAYRKMSEADLAADKELSRASVQAQRGKS